MLEPDGSYTYNTILGGPRTLKAYRLSTAPDPVAPLFPNAPKNGTPAPYEPSGEMR
jgi:hypothetical protein